MGSRNPADQAYGGDSIWSTLKTWIYFWTMEGGKKREKREEKMTLAFRSEGKLPGTKINPRKTKKDMTYPWPTHSPAHFVPTTYQALPTPSSSPYCCEGAGAVKSDSFIPTWVDQVDHLAFSILSPPPLFPVKSDNLLSGNDSDWGVSCQYWHSTFPTRGSHSSMRDWLFLSK